MATDQNQELRSLDKSIMAAQFDESSKNEPEMWYKIVPNTGAGETAESPLHNEDEPNMSRGIYL